MRMLRKKMMCMFGVCMAHAAFAGDVSHREAMSQYVNIGQAVKEELRTRDGEPQAMMQKLEEMLAHARPALERYSEKYPQCKAQLQKLLELYPEFINWDPEQIRSAIEVGRALPRASGCYPARDVVSHPAIVRAWLYRDAHPDQWPGLEQEIADGLGNMDQLLRTLNP